MEGNQEVIIKLLKTRLLESSSNLGELKEADRPCGRFGFTDVEKDQSTMVLWGWSKCGEGGKW